MESFPNAVAAVLANKGAGGGGWGVLHKGLPFWGYFTGKKDFRVRDTYKVPMSISAGTLIPALEQQRNPYWKCNLPLVVAQFTPSK